MKKLLFLPVVVLILTGCNKPVTQEPPTSQPIQEITQEVAPVSSDYWEGYTKPEGWITLTNQEFGFSVDIPEEWRRYSDPNSSLISRAGKGIMASSGRGVNVRFAIRETDENYVYTTPTFPELEGNEELIEKAGNAFKYFRGAYSQDQEFKKDDLIIFYPVGVTKKELTLDNLISVNANRKNSEENKAFYPEDIKKAKTVIKSFRKN